MKRGGYASAAAAPSMNQKAGISAGTQSRKQTGNRSITITSCAKYPSVRYPHPMPMPSYLVFCQVVESKPGQIRKIFPRASAKLLNSPQQQRRELGRLHQTHPRRQMLRHASSALQKVANLPPNPAVRPAEDYFFSATQNFACTRMKGLSSIQSVLNH